jgi:RHS repeat-associated protein
MIAQTNTATHVVTNYTYDYRNRLTEVTVGGTVVATYTYDALDRRIGFDDNGTQTWTVYDGTNPYADFNGSGTLLERYLFGPGVVNAAVVDELLARTSSGGTTAWYLDDKLGSVRDIVNTSGTELDHVVYDSFGNIVTETNAANGDRFKFSLMQYDATTGQYYDHARGYVAALGRFTSQDPLGLSAGDSNVYRYVGNSPTNATDPTGTVGGFFVGQLGGFFGSPGVSNPGSPGDIVNIPTGPINPGDVASFPAGPTNPADTAPMLTGINTDDTKKPPLPRPIPGPMTAPPQHFPDGRIYQQGLYLYPNGQTGWLPSPTWEVWDSKTNQWVALPPAHSPPGYEGPTSTPGGPIYTPPFAKAPPNRLASPPPPRPPRPLPVDPGRPIA